MRRQREGHILHLLGKLLCDVSVDAISADQLVFDLAMLREARVFAGKVQDLIERGEELFRVVGVDPDLGPLFRANLARNVTQAAAIRGLRRNLQRTLKAVCERTEEKNGSAF